MQPLLIPTPSKKKLILSIILIPIGIVVVGVLLLKGLGRYTDKMEQYFPKDHVVYLNVTLTNETLANPLVKKIIDKYPSAAILITGNIKKSLEPYRNFSLALYEKDGKVSTICALRFKKSLKIDDFYSDLSQYGLGYASVTKLFSGDRIVLISEDKELLSTAREYIKNKKFFSPNLSSLDIKGTGSMVLNADLLKKLAPTAFNQALDQFHSNVELTLELNNDNIRALTPGYTQGTIQPFKLIKKAKIGFYLPNPLSELDKLNNEDILKWLELAQKVYSFDYSDIKNSKPIAVSYEEVANNQYLTRVFFITSETSEKIGGILNRVLVQAIAVKNKKYKTVVLPDGTLIQELVKDTQSVKEERVEDRYLISDLVEGDKYEIWSDGMVLSLAKNISKDSFTTSTPNDCFVNPANNAFLTDISGILPEDFIEKLVVTGFPQGYPQFAACIY